MTAAVLLWQGGELRPYDWCDVAETRLEAADSWLVDEGRVRALELHRQRFESAVPAHRRAELDLSGFWAATVAAIPRSGRWFPRVELQSRSGGRQLVLRMREAPPLRRSLVLATVPPPDPRRVPHVKGPDLAAMTAARAALQSRGADEGVLLSEDGWVVEGTTTALVWWRGEELVLPDAALARVDSVTARSLLALCAALSVPVRTEFASPDELDGLEVWALNALHGVRMVTGWVDGPGVAEQPGRFALWRSRMESLARPLP